MSTMIKVLFFLLPPVTYFTRMDQFILLSTAMVFISLLHTVVTCSYAKRTSSPWVHRINILSRAIYPIILIGVLGASFAW